MTRLNETSVKASVLRALNAIAPEVDGAGIDPTKDLRDQVDLDSVDFLNFVIGLHKEFGVEIPDADVAKLATLKGCVDYLSARLGGG